MGELRSNFVSPCSFLRGNTIRADVQMSDTLPAPEKPSSGTEKIVGGGRTRQEGVSVAC
jgi:hypothetical protein